MIFVIGIGAAGNKATIKAVELGLIDRSNFVLINTTTKDIAPDYIENAIIIGKDRGCGKERSISLQAISSYIQKVENDDFINIPANVERIVIVTSTEGGTGSGATPILDKYIRNVMGYNVSIFAFAGFEDDARGILNTINFMKELEEDKTTIQIISNKKFLDETKNYSRAQELANEEFCKRLVIMSGKILEESDQNIDDTDLHKLIDAPGLLDITYTDIEEPIKNIENFNKICSNMIDESKSIDFAPTATRLGFIFNGKLSSRDSIDYSYSVLKNKYGEPFEIYTHLQENTYYKTEFVACIASGMNLPIDAMKKIYDEYLNKSSKVSKTKDSFFGDLKEMSASTDDDIFDMKKREDVISKDDFFKNNF